MDILEEALYHQRVARSEGFDWPNSLDVIDKIKEELIELANAIKANERQGVIDEFGDLLMVITNLSLHLNLELESCLAQGLDKFKQRYKVMLELSEDKELDFSKLSLNDKEKLWLEAKIRTS